MKNSIDNEDVIIILSNINENIKVCYLNFFKRLLDEKAYLYLETQVNSRKKCPRVQII